MESVKVANVDISKFLALDESKPTKSKLPFYCTDFLVKMLEEGVHADVTFQAKGGSVAAHKCVLACVSPVFNAMFQHNMKEKITSTVDIPDMTVSALQLFLLLLYITDEDEGDDDSPMPELSAAIDKHFDEFHKAALKYQVESRLGSELVSAVARNLSLDNCWNYYDLLKAARSTNYQVNACTFCLDYMVGNYSEVIKSKRFLEEMKSNPVQVLQLIRAADKRCARETSRMTISKKMRR